MYNGLHQTPPTGMRVTPQPKDRPTVQIVPFDHVARFELKGEPGRLREDVINISVEGTFIALAVGYGLSPDMRTPFKLVDPPPAPPPPEPMVPPPLETAEAPLQPIEDKCLADVTLGHIPPHVLMDGFRLNPALEQIAFPASKDYPDGRMNESLSVKLANDEDLFQWIQGDWIPELGNFNFLYNFIDTGTGREMQNAPIHNIAGLGKANGERPFRMLAKPLAFLPRSSVRIQVEEKSETVKGDLFIVLHGYKILGAAGVAEEHLRSLYQRAMRRYGPQAAARRTIRHLEQRTLPSARLVPFDYVGSLELTGQADNLVETEIPVNVEGGFVATAVGYSLATDEVVIGKSLTDDRAFYDLGTIKLSQIPISALKSGFRIKEAFHSIAFQNGVLAANVTGDTVGQLFEPLNRSENVRFLYSIADTGTGREWQNEPVLNIAGLGIANGDRPFRNLAWPMHFLPRSTVFLRVRELFGKGRLFIVFQGYKMLGVSS